MFSERRCGERGAVLALGAAGIGALLLVAALVVDLGVARSDRAGNQVVTDAAAASGIVGLVDVDGRGACEAALGYAEVHIGAVSGASCASFPTTCDEFTPTVTTSGTVDGRTITITHPVDDGDPLMQPGTAGSNLQPTVDADGDRCDRIGVRVDDPRAALFGVFAGINSVETSTHSVARINEEYGRNLVINLLLLERHECEALSVGGGGSNGGVTVGPVNDPDTGDIYPGRIALDSDGTVGCGGTIHSNGSGATIQADGEAGCANELAPVGLGLGCGSIETFAPGTPGCNVPACSSSGIIAPLPTQSPRRLTRAPIDWMYNCNSSYPSSYDIRRCPDAGSRPGYIDNLVAGASSGSGFQSYLGAGFPCSVGGGPATVIIVPIGNWFVDCGDLRVQRQLIFAGGNIIFAGDVSVGSSGNLSINATNPTPYPYWFDGLPLDLGSHSAGAAFAYMSDGTLSKAGGASLELSNTTVYLSATSELSLGGGAGSMVWTAPTEGPLENLALWSESPLDHSFAGSATLTLEGVFFTPLATIVYTGNGGQSTVEAQFISNKLQTQGNGSLKLQPKFNRAVRHPPPAISELIR